MDKFNSSETSVGVEFISVVDKDTNVIAFEAVRKLKEDIPNQEGLQFPSSEFSEDQIRIDYYYKLLALESYTGSHPLILNTIPGGIHPYPISLPEPKSFALVLMVDQPKNGMTLDELKRLSNRGIDFMMMGYGQSFLSLLSLIQIRPKFIHLSWDVVEACRDNDMLHAVANMMKPYRDMGIKIYVDCLESHEEIERFTAVADVFRANWLPSPEESPRIL